MKARNIALWIINILLFVVMVILAGRAKVMGNSQVQDSFVRYGLGVGFSYFIGVCEILGGIGGLIPRTRFWAIAGLIPIMLGAVYMHTTHHEYDHLPTAVIVLVLCIISAVGRRNEAGRIFAKGGLFTGV